MGTKMPLTMFLVLIVAMFAFAAVVSAVEMESAREQKETATIDTIKSAAEGTTKFTAEAEVGTDIEAERIAFSVTDPTDKDLVKLQAEDHVADITWGHDFQFVDAKLVSEMTDGDYTDLYLVTFVEKRANTGMGVATIDKSVFLVVSDSLDLYGAGHYRAAFAARTYALPVIAEVETVLKIETVMINSKSAKLILPFGCMDIARASPLDAHIEETTRARTTVSS